MTDVKTPTQQIAMLATCMPGGHNEHLRETRDGFKVLPLGWRFVSAQFVNGRWIVAPNSETKVPCCDRHHPQR